MDVPHRLQYSDVADQGVTITGRSNVASIKHFAHAPIVRGNHTCLCHLSDGHGIDGRFLSQRTWPFRYPGKASPETCKRCQIYALLSNHSVSKNLLHCRPSTRHQSWCWFIDRDSSSSMCYSRHVGIEARRTIRIFANRVCEVKPRWSNRPLLTAAFALDGGLDYGETLYAFHLLICEEAIGPSHMQLIRITNNAT
jgi:hypothetical protein